MIDRNEYPTDISPEEIHEIVRKAEALRAEAVRDGLAATFRWIARLPGRLVRLVSGGARRPA